jgi:uncharacterized membrane protein
MAQEMIKKIAASEDPVAGIMDLLLVDIWFGIALLCIFLPPLNTSVFRVVFALPIILFIPGYVLIASLFPNKDDLDAIERIALSFGLSIAIVPLTGLALNYTPWGIRLEPIVASLILLTGILSLVATFRRLALLPTERFTVPFRSIAHDAKSAIFPARGPAADRILNIILLASILTAIGATVYVIAVPKEGEQFTEFYILGEQGKAADYPRDLVVGTAYPLIIGIGNHEYRNVTYTVEVDLMNMTFDPATNVSTVTTMSTLDRFQIVLPHNTTQEIPWNLTTSKTGFNRVEFLLFNETVPNDAIRLMDRVNASYRDLHLWVNISSGNG